MPTGSRFIRLQGAGGDGGLECFWQLPNGAEWGWQCKLLRRLDKNQIRDSIRTALRIHPRLKRFVVCLPFDLTGPTGRGGKDQRTLWGEYVREWKRLAARRGKQIEIELWTKSDLTDRLISSDPTGGRHRFWFDEQRLGYDWFTRHIADALIDAGPRYHPELSVQVPISDMFDALGQTPRWRSAWVRQLQGLQREAQRFRLRATERQNANSANRPAQQMLVAADLLEAALTGLHQLWADHADGVEAPTLDASREATGLALDALGDAREALRDELQAQYGPGAVDNASFRQYQAEYMLTFPAEDYDRAGKLLEELGRARDALYGPQAEAIREGVVLVTGMAGAGKTHAICDGASHRLKEGLLSVVVLGEKLADGEVSDQVRQILGFPADLGRDEMLAALDAAGEASHAPLLVFVDALNERAPRTAWKNELASFVVQIRRYTWLRLCLSCRTTYLDAVMPDQMYLPTIEHRGFSGREFEACFAFFAHWNLEPPAVPLLQPEYANPLFLRMVCVGLSRSDRISLTDRPPSLGEVVELLVTSAEHGAEERLDVDRRDEYVRQALNAVLDEMRATGALHLSWQRASEVVNRLLPGRPRSKSLLEFLLREGLLTEVQTAASGERSEQVRFGFERLGEYLFARRAIEGMDQSSIGQLFARDGQLPLTAGRYTPENLQGLAEALALLLPERFCIEVVDADVPLSSDHLVDAVVRSLPWRRPDTFTERTEEVIREALSIQGISRRALEEVVSLAARAGHPFGAEFFDRLMREKAQPDRDVIMCRFLHLSWEENGVARRLSEWALRPDLGPLSHEIAVNWAQTLLWFCVAADRRVRDYATMGIVALTQQHPEAWPILIEKFRRVDDEYVTERVLLAAYGSLIRSNNADALGACAQPVWAWIFRDNPPLNGLLRDYARCIIEMAAERSVLPAEVDLDLCRPPYRSSWPEDWAIEEEVAETRAQGQTEDQQARHSSQEEGPALRRLRASVEGDDFAVYTMTSAFQTHDRQEFDIGAAKGWILREIERMGFSGARFDAYDGYMLSRYGGGRGRPNWAERIGKKYQWIALYRLLGLVGDHIRLDRTNRGREAEVAVALQAPGERNLDPTLLLRQSATARKSSWWAPMEMDFQIEVGDEAWLKELTFPDSAQLIEVVEPTKGRRWLALQTYANWDARNEEASEEEIGAAYRDCFMMVRSYLVSEDQEERVWRWLRSQDLHGRWMPEGTRWLSYVFGGEYPWSVQAHGQLVTDRTELPSSRVPFEIIPTSLDQSLEFEFDSYHEETVNLILPNYRFFQRNRIRWDGIGGYLRADGQPAFCMPSLTSPGPSTLLADREWLESWLQENKLRLMWTALSEKRILGDLKRSDGLGYTVHSRAHRLMGGQIRSSQGITVRHEPPRQAPVKRRAHRRP